MVHISFLAVIVFGLGKDLLFKSVLGRCEPYLAMPWEGSIKYEPVRRKALIIYFGLHITLGRNFVLKLHFDFVEATILQKVFLGFHF